MLISTGELFSFPTPPTITRLSKELPAGLFSQLNSFEHISKPKEGATFVFLLVDILQGEMDIPIPIFFPIHVYDRQLNRAAQLESLLAK